jgi:hypothetical protein
MRLWRDLAGQVDSILADVLNKVDKKPITAEDAWYKQFSHDFDEGSWAGLGTAFPREAADFKKVVVDNSPAAKAAVEADMTKKAADVDAAVQPLLSAKLGTRPQAVKDFIHAVHVTRRPWFFSFAVTKSTWGQMTSDQRDGIASTFQDWATEFCGQIPTCAASGSKDDVFDEIVSEDGVLLSQIADHKLLVPYRP